MCSMNETIKSWIIFTLYTFSLNAFEFVLACIYRSISYLPEQWKSCREFFLSLLINRLCKNIIFSLLRSKEWMEKLVLEVNIFSPFLCAITFSTS
jgi:hypothetical protein